MRNALVLVPLCIGFTSGFIVSTSTQELSTISVNNVLPSSTATLFDKNEVSSKTSHESLDTESNQESEITKDLFSETEAKDNNIIERSFIFINQRWKKQPKKSYLIDSKHQNTNNKNIQKSTVFNLYQEPRQKPPKNFVSKVSNTDTKYFSNKQRHVIDKVVPDNSHFPPVQEIGTLKPKSNNNLKPNKKHQSTNDKQIHFSGQGEFIELLKAPLIRSDNARGVDKLSEDNDVIFNRNYDNVNINNENKQKPKLSSNTEINDQLKQKPNNRGRHENPPLFKDKVHDLVDELNEEIVWDKLFQHTLEQVSNPKATHKEDHNVPNNEKYCQECASKANLQKIDEGILTECRCKCGRYIHLRGRPDLKDLVDKKRNDLNKEGLLK